MKYTFIKVTFCMLFCFTLTLAKGQEEGSGKWVLINKKGQEVSAPIYDEIGVPTRYSNGIRDVNIGRKWGCIDENAKEIIPIVYDMIYTFRNELAIVKNNGSYGVINTKNDIVIPIAYEELKRASDKVFSVSKDILEGYFLVNKKGRTISKTYYEMGYFEDGLSLVENEQGKKGYINESGEEIVPVKLYDAKDFSEGYAAVAKYGQWGFIDTTGKMVIDDVYDNVGSFSEGLAAVEKDDMWGYINTDAAYVIPANYYMAYSFIKGIAEIETDENYGFINNKGKLLISDPNQSKSKRLPMFKKDHTDTFRVEIDGKWGIYNRDGKEVAPVIYDEISMYFEEDAAVVSLDNKKGLIDTSGKLITPITYDSCDYFHDGLALVGKDGKYGFVNHAGKEIIPLKYKHAAHFSEGYAAVRIEDKWGFIDKTGELVIPYKYDNVWGTYFHDGMVEVKK